jgi:hypothetical protein
VGEAPLTDQFSQTLIKADLILEKVPFTSSSDNYPGKSQPWISLFLCSDKDRPVGFRLATETDMETYTRQQLHDLVWSGPMREVAKRLGLSDNGLRKHCVKPFVPLPPQGHWNRSGRTESEDYSAAASTAGRASLFRS